MIYKHFFAVSKKFKQILFGFYLFNSIKAGGSKSMYILAFGAPPRKRPESIGMGLKCIFIAQFYGQLKEKKLTDNFSSLGAMEGGKKYQSVTHVSTGIFNGFSII